MIAQFYFLLQIVAPVFVVMALGYLMRKVGILSSEADRSLTRLVVTLLAPSLAERSVRRKESTTISNLVSLHILDRKRLGQEDIFTTSS